MGGVLTTEYIGTVKFFSYFKGMGFIIEDLQEMGGQEGVPF